MFALNLKPLLMQPPVKGKVTMGLDPGYAHGCKVAVIDGTGKVLDTAVVYPTYGDRQKNEAIRMLSQLIRKHGVEHIAIGNGTASRETEQMTGGAASARSAAGVSYMIVKRGGRVGLLRQPAGRGGVPRVRREPAQRRVHRPAAAGSAGGAGEDRPQGHRRGAVSARYARRSSWTRRSERRGRGLRQRGGRGREHGFPLASAARVGSERTTAKNIVTYREENGAFTSRSQIKKVPKLGPKAFEQCAGFLRVPESKSVLDNTAVHPESYDAAQGACWSCADTRSRMSRGEPPTCQRGSRRYGDGKGRGGARRRRADAARYRIRALKPGRDPRDELPAPMLRTDVLEIKDFKPGMVLTGTVRNVIDFGVFVDIGVHQDGLVHISQVCDRFIKHPSEVVAVGDVVKVVVLDVDEKKHRISLTMKIKDEV